MAVGVMTQTLFNEAGGEQRNRSGDKKWGEFQRAMLLKTENKGNSRDGNSCRGAQPFSPARGEEAHSECCQYPGEECDDHAVHGTKGRSDHSESINLVQCFSP